jgi:hypothetical protein
MSSLTTKNKKLIRFLIILSVVISLFVTEYIFTAYQYNQLINKIQNSENIALSFYEEYRPRPEITGDIKTGIFFEYTKIDGTKVTDSFATAWDAWREDMKSISITKKKELSTVQSDIDSVSFFPWQSQNNLAKNSYLEHNKAWVSWLSVLADSKNSSDLDNFFNENFNVTSTFSTATTNLEKAVPKVDFFGIKNKVNRIIQDDNDLETK